MQRHLIVTADDFGLHQAVNEAVEQANRGGILTAASLMVSGSAAVDAVQRACQMQISLEADLPPIDGDMVQLQQVLLNLVLNGFDAMSDTPMDLNGEGLDCAIRVGQLEDSSLIARKIGYLRNVVCASWLVAIRYCST